MNEKFGHVSSEDGLPRVEFARVLDAAIDTVWALLSTEGGLEKWLAHARVDLRLGGTMDIDFGEGGVSGGEIIDLVPGVAIEYRWAFTGEPESIVRFELEVIDSNTTRLHLIHRLLPVDQATGYSAGWHAHLDKLEAAASGQGQVDWLDRYQEVLPDYGDRSA